MDRWDLEKQIVLRALKDPIFNKKLLSHPKEAIKETFKDKFPEDLPDNIQVKVHQEKQNEWTISIPYLDRKDKSKKLSDTELEKLFAATGCRVAAPGMLGTTY